MKLSEKHQRLLAAYSGENLNLISAKLIELYKNKNYSTLFEISNKVGINEDQPAKCFSQLIKLYHPDRGEQHRNEIERIIQQERYSLLKAYDHILTIDINSMQVKPYVDDDIDYNPEYVYDDGYTGFDADGNYVEDLDNRHAKEEEPDESYEPTFYNILKLRLYGHIDIEIPPYYLHDHDEVEITNHDMEYLDGIEHCIHARKINLSQNLLTDLSGLVSLQHIEELNLSDNNISYLDALSNLSKLKKLNIADNQIEDLTPLYELEHLSIINIEGNDVPDEQIEYLNELGVVVIK